MIRRKILTHEEVHRSRQLRKNLSVAEQIFWKKALRAQLGFEFGMQYAFHGIVLDFYCIEAALAVEFDGEQHDPVKDAARDERMREYGVQTLRIHNRDFFMLDASDQPPADWIEVIIKACEGRTGRIVPR